MPIDPIFQDLRDLTLPLAHIFLDPNNPRFAGSDWQYIPDASIEAAQESTRLKLVADFDVDKLRMNMEVNGYLPIDRVIVREFAPNKYVVLEGNRRICAAKRISAVGMDGSEVTASVLASVGQIPCLEYVGNEEDASWIFQGLRHITGISEWSAFNKAKLLVEQMEEEQVSLTEAGRRFGLTRFGAGQWVRGYYAFKQAREESDYVREVDERSYPYFQELFSRSSAPVREWLEWNEDEYKFRNTLNLNEFVGWLYPRSSNSPEGSPEAEGEESEQTGEWEHRFLARRDDIRLTAWLLRNAPSFFEQFRIDGQLEKAYTMASAEVYQKKATEKADVTRDLFEALASCSKALENLPLRVLLDPRSRSDLHARLDALQRVIVEIRQTDIHATA